jgi:hypothetical protein
MKNDHKGKAKNEVGVELKYCEHCGFVGARVWGRSLLPQLSGQSGGVAGCEEATKQDHSSGPAAGGGRRL